MKNQSSFRGFNIVLLKVEIFYKSVYLCHNVGVDHRRLNTLVSEKFLD